MASALKWQKRIEQQEKINSIQNDEQRLRITQMFDDAANTLGSRTDYLEDQTIEQAAQLLAQARIELALNLTEPCNVES
jgi:DNA-binding MurR/RpiR family transcriptional regulator